MTWSGKFLLLVAKFLEDASAFWHSRHCWHGGYNGYHGCAAKAFSLFIIILFGVAAFGKMGVYS